VLVDAFEPAANFVSARQVEVDATPERLWEVLPELPELLRTSRWAPLAAVPMWVASRMRQESASERAGFAVGRIDPGKEVVLVGHHRLADYATNLYVEPVGTDRSRLHNVTRARFKTAGLGHVYLAGVHVFHDRYIDWMLRALKRRAETNREAGV
jgi:hypothetical protein